MGNRNSVYADLGDEFLTQALNSHNKYRAIHKCPPLTHAEDLSEMAQKIAFYISSRQKTMKRRINRERAEDSIGENVAIKILTQGDDYKGDEVTDDWYDEAEFYRKYYLKNIPSDNYDKIVKNFSNFTQLIWKNTKEVGFGKVKANNRIIVVACYRPAGNIKGQFRDNVPPILQEGCCYPSYVKPF